MEKISLRTTYERIIVQFMLRNELHFDTEDQLRRAANIYAVKTTTKSWKDRCEYLKLHL